MHIFANPVTCILEMGRYGDMYIGVSQYIVLQYMYRYNMHKVSIDTSITMYRCVLINELLSAMDKTLKLTFYRKQL